MVDLELTPSDPAKAALANEEKWRDSVHALERELAIYRNASTSGGTPEDMLTAAQRIAAAARAMPGAPPGSLADGPPSYQLPPLPEQDERAEPPLPRTPRSKLRKQPQNADDAESESDASSTREMHPGRQVGRGFLMVFATPLALVGMGIYACGMMLEGGAMMLKGAGSIGRLPLEKVRGSLKGNKKGRKGGKGGRK